MIATALLADLRLDLNPDDAQLMPVRLVCGPQVVIGRNKNECDLVSWFIPRTAENDRETLKLSQVHCYLVQDGPGFRVRDADSATGTFWNGRPAPAGEGCSASVGVDGKLSLGRNFHVGVEWIPAGQSVCAALRPLVSEPVFRKCLWMPAARCGFVMRAGERLIWLHPAGAGEAPDVTVEARGRELWWCPADGAAVKIRDGARLSAGGLALKARVRQGSAE